MPKNVEMTKTMHSAGVKLVKNTFAEESQLKKLKDNAFSSCTTLKTISLPESVGDISESRFLISGFLISNFGQGPKTMSYFLTSV